MSWPFVGKLSFLYLREFDRVWAILSIGSDKVEALQVKHRLIFEMGPRILVAFV